MAADDGARFDRLSARKDAPYPPYGLRVTGYGLEHQMVGKFRGSLMPITTFIG